jgi:hypothetical protein
MLLSLPLPVYTWSKRVSSYPIVLRAQWLVDSSLTEVPRPELLGERHVGWMCGCFRGSSVGLQGLYGGCAEGVQVVKAVQYSAEVWWCLYWCRAEGRGLLTVVLCCGSAGRWLFRLESRARERPLEVFNAEMSWSTRKVHFDICLYTSRNSQAIVAKMLVRRSDD